MLTLADQIAAACSPAAWEAARRYDGATDEQWAARAEKRASITAICERAADVARANPRARVVRDLRKLGGLTTLDLETVERRLLAAQAAPAA